MKSKILNYLERESRYWWTSLIVGILAIILSIWCLATPLVTLFTITYIFIIGLILSGIIDIISAVFNRKTSGWGWTLAGGIIDILLGLLLVTLPLPMVTSILIFLIGFWILFRSIWTIGIAVDLNKYANASFLLVLGILSLLFAVFYLFSPIFNGVAVVSLISIAFLFYGVFRIVLSFKLRKLNKETREYNKTNNEADSIDPIKIKID